ncbi:MAG TPA: thiamine pyrophosphate-binding protein [Desulfobacterales bacterium]|nr:thiamine pyrophosphate-binding protein [Desulfobacterales bacterium]
MKASDLVVQTLIEAGIKRVFTLPGMGITWFLDSFRKRSKQIEVVLARSEQVASIMAQVAGRLTGKPGVFMGQGPWVATTGAFGILEAFFSGSPMLILTETSDYDGLGQYGVYQTMTGDYGAADIQSTLRGITKFCTYATEPQDAVYGTQLALKHASLPRRGPAAVIMKTTIIKREVTVNPKVKLYPTYGYLSYTPARPDQGAIDTLAGYLNKARYPVIVAGHGAVEADIGKKLQNLASSVGCAVATSYNGKGVIDETSEIAVGMLGTWGCPTANRILKAADLIIILGASMGPDYTRFRDPTMIRPGDQILVQVDHDPRNSGWVYPVNLAITGDVGDVIDYLNQCRLDRTKKQDRIQWIDNIKKATNYYTPPSLPSAPGSLHNTDVVGILQSFLSSNDILTLDAGSNRIWATHNLRIKHPHQLLMPGGIGGMGWGGPAAAAAQMIYPNKRVTSLAGDGGFLMTIDVVATCVQHNLPVTFIVSNNQGLGMVRDNQGNQRIATDFGYVDFAKIAEGMGARGMSVDTRDGLEDALYESHKNIGPAVINVSIDPEASYLPASDSAPL